MIDKIIFFFDNAFNVKIRKYLEDSEQIVSDCRILWYLQN